MLRILEQGEVWDTMSDTLQLDNRAPSPTAAKQSVTFQRPDFAVFRFQRGSGAENPLNVHIDRIPTFIVPSDSGFWRWWGSLKAASARVKISGLPGGSYPLRPEPARRNYFRGPSWTMSVAVHTAAILLIVYVHQQIPDSASAFDSPVSQPEVIYYRVPVQKLPKTLPHISAPAPGGRPLTGSLPLQAPAAGSTAPRSVLTIVSKPAHPDNFHQTIIQPSSPPDLKITSDLKLPNIILGKPLDAPKAPMQFNATAAKPTQKDRQISADPAPTLNSENSPNPVMTFLTPSKFKPSMPMAVNSGASQRKSSGASANVEAPNVTTTSGDSVTLAVTTTSFKPSMPVAAASGAAQRKTLSGSGNVEAPNVTATSGDSMTLAVISSDPAAIINAADIMVPPGNRSGEFSTTISENSVGSPGADRAGVIGGGPGTTGKGGDGSTGPGRSSGGGGGVSVSEGPMTINGASTNSVGSGLLGAALARGIVYPVPAAFNIRRNSLIVSAGPIGGGGLDAYGALHCGKIYTIFLPMPGKNWTMQYCAQGAAEPEPTENQPPTVVHFGGGIVPPQAESKYDFQRSPVTPEKAGKVIILKGLLRADGLIDQLQVYQGVLPEMDDNARLAFSQWKFKPALRDGKAIPVQVLLGIPATVPASGDR